MNPKEDFDLRGLEARGWSRRMVAVLLCKEDYRLPVNHFRNFSGKMMFERWRVEAAEASEEFRKLFTASKGRRALEQPFVKEVLARSRALEAGGAQWGTPPLLTDREYAIARMATCLRLLRMRGGRTPHKG